MKQSGQKLGWPHLSMWRCVEINVRDKHKCAYLLELNNEHSGSHLFDPNSNRSATTETQEGLELWGELGELFSPASTPYAELN